MPVAGLARSFIVSIFALLMTACASRRDVVREPESTAGFEAGTFTALDTTMNRAIHDGLVPGAVLSIGRHGRTVYEYAVGSRDLSPRAGNPPMTRDTVVDVASLTKPVATATAAALLMADGKLSDGDEVAPGVTLGAALCHRNSLPAYVDWRALPRDADSPRGAVLAWLAGHSPAEAQTDYSNVGYVLAAGLVEERAGRGLEAILRERAWGPLGMAHTTFRTAKLDARARFARTALDVEPGSPYDPLAAWIVRAYAAHDPGHSGLFSTTGDLTRFAQGLLHPDSTPTSDTMRLVAASLFSAPDTTIPANAGDFVEGATSRTRGFAFDPDDARRRVLYHTGYTGTLLWIDRDTGISVVLLTNATHRAGSDWQSLQREVLRIVQKRTLGRR